MNSLKPAINALCNTAVTIKTIGNLVSNRSMPQGCTPVCRLGITNPPVTLKRNWNECLRECGHQLTAILINHHLETMLKNIPLTINSEFQIITSEFQATIPNSNRNLDSLRMKSHNSYTINWTTAPQSEEKECQQHQWRPNLQISNCNSYHPTKKHQCYNTVW